MTFKVGDKVITTKDHDECGDEVFPVGTVGKVIKVFDHCDHGSDVLSYRVEADGGSWRLYTEDMLEPYGEAKQTKTTEVRGERYDTHAVAGIVENLSNQIVIAYERGYKHGNLDGYQRGFEDGKDCEDKLRYDGAAIYHLRESGWLAEHDREITTIAYQRGFKDGKIEGESKYKESYNQESYDQGHAYGLGEAWGIARKAEQMLFDGNHFKECFGDTDFHTVLNSMQASEVAQKIQEYEAKKKTYDNLYVGDEVLIHNEDGDDIKAVVLGILSVGKIWLLNERGIMYVHEMSDDQTLIKTEHSYFGEIQDLLEKLRED